MFERGRETLPGALTDEARQKNLENILFEIEQSLENPNGLSESSKEELIEEIPKVERAINRLAMKLTVMFDQEAA